MKIGFSSSYVARRGMGNYHENRCPPSFRRRPESRGGAVDSRFRGSDGGETVQFSFPYVARRGMGNYHENSQRPAASMSFLRSGLSQCHSERAKRVEESKVLDFGIAGESLTPPPLDSGLRQNDGREADRHFHPLTWPAKTWEIIMKIGSRRAGIRGWGNWLGGPRKTQVSRGLSQNCPGTPVEGMLN